MEWGSACFQDARQREVFLISTIMFLFHDFVYNLNCWYLLVKEGEFFWSIRKKTNAIGIRCHSNQSTKKSTKDHHPLLMFNKKYFKNQHPRRQGNKLPRSPRSCLQSSKASKWHQTKITSGSLQLIMTGKLFFKQAQKILQVNALDIPCNTL